MRSMRSRISSTQMHTEMPWPAARIANLILILLYRHKHHKHTPIEKTRSMRGTTPPTSWRRATTFYTKRLVKQCLTKLRIETDSSSSRAKYHRFKSLKMWIWSKWTAKWCNRTSSMALKMIKRRQVADRARRTWTIHSSRWRSCLIRMVRIQITWTCQMKSKRRS